MPIYRVRNRVSGEQYEVRADYAAVACQRLGWMIGDCWVQRMDDPAEVGRVSDGDDLANAPTGESGT